MARTFQIKRGLRAKLSTLAQGEFAMTTDSGSEALWLGTGDQNKKIPLDPTAADVGAVARDGSNAMTHALEVSSASYNDQLKVKRPAQGDVVIGFYGPEQKGVFGFDHNGKLFVRFGGSTASADSKEVLHTGNKPIGIYTGNGSAAARTIATGGSGRWVAIDASVNGVVAIVSAYGGAVYKVGDTIGTLSPTQAYFRNGVLTIATSTVINTNGAQYAYQVL